MEVKVALSSEIHATDASVRCMKTFTYSGVGYLAVGDYNDFLTIIKCNQAELVKVKSLKAHSLSLSSVYWQEPSNTYPEGVFLTSGFDGLIKFWALSDLASDQNDINPIRTLNIHHSTVSCTYITDSGKVLSSSWDKTLKLTSSDGTTVTIYHENDQIVCATQTDFGYIACGKSCTITLVDDNGNILCKVEHAHKINIRQVRYYKQTKSLYTIGDDGFLTEWIVNSSEIKKKRTLKISNEYIYHFNMKQNQIVIGGEDHCVFIVDKMHWVIRDVIALQSTIWAQVYLPNQDLAIATEDGYVRTFTHNITRRAPQERQKQFAEEVANTVLWIPSLQSTKINSLPENTNALEAVPGTLYAIKDKNDIRIVTYSKSQKWIRIGKLRHQRTKLTYKDKQYDVGFDFDIGNGKQKTIYLNYNDSPFVVASSFVIEHKLDPSLIPRVEAAVLQNYEPLLTRKLTNDHQEKSGILGPLSYGVAAMCGRRDTMEDAHFCLEEAPNVYCFGIFDGHGGNGASNYCSERLPYTIRSNRCQGNFYKVMFPLVQNVMAKQFYTCGTTVLVSSFVNGILSVANLGDTRCVLCRQTPQRMSVDHRASLPEETKYVEEKGGKVINGRIMGSLQVSRALGDGLFKDYVNTKPSYMEERLVPGDRVIMACDGIWDVLSDEEASEIVRNSDSPLKAAKQVRDEAFNRGSNDNLSVIVIFTKHD